MPRNLIVTGAFSGFGAMTARALADACHRVYAGNLGDRLRADFYRRIELTDLLCPHLS